MRNFFRCLDAHRVSYLLISGQASVLYGAATFSEDVDIWVAPTKGDVMAFRRAVVEAGARYHKLTPPLSFDFAVKGHGFHFVVPDEEFGETYLDVMFRPPRVGSYASARKKSRILETAWGVMPVVGIRDLVRLKRTRRLSDYEVISNLVEIELRGLADSPRRRRDVVRWALANSFRAETLAAIVDRLPGGRSLAALVDREALVPLLGPRVDLEACRARIAAEIAQIQSEDVAYWSPIIADLRALRSVGRLMPAGQLVEA